MPQFFIHRPVFAWVIAIFIALAGILAIPALPIAQYPSVAPPQIVITAVYPGATPKSLDEAVVSLIERELSGVDDLLYFESTSDTSGTAQITATFAPGTNPDLAQVDVQNRLKVVEPRLPEVVRRTGLSVEQASSNFLLIVTLHSKSGAWSAAELGDYMARRITDELRRLEGVGRIQSFRAEQAMRIWIDPARLVAYGLGTEDVTAAIRAQNALVAPGRLGGLPATGEQQVSIPLRVTGQLGTPEEFGAIILRAQPDGALVRLRDVARVEIGPQSFATASRLNGTPVAALAVQLAPDANAVATSERVHERLRALSEGFPDDLVARVPYDTAPFVETSIEKVVETLLEAMVLVFLVMFIFLQSVRYTVIPAIVVPIALLGAFAVMWAFGFSINMLTMFGLVMAIGIVVDDAIVVVENVERIMAEEQLAPREATEKAMREITSAVVGITLVLSAVFIPMAFAVGSVGVIFRQFTVSLTSSILISAFLALSLTPALCAMLLKPVRAGHHEKRFFKYFNRGFNGLNRRYAGSVTGLVRHRVISMIVYAVVAAATAFMFLRLPSAFLPEEDQGYVITSIQLPADATAERTLDTVKALEEHMLAQPGVRDIISVVGFGFAGQGQNAALAFTMLEDFDERPSGVTAQRLAASANRALADVSDGVAMTLIPPAISELGTAVGFEMRLEDRAQRGQVALLQASQRLLAAANQSPLLQNVYVEGLPPGPVMQLDIDREKASALGVRFSSINEAISTAMGSTYVNDFPNEGRMQRVIVQAKADARMELEQVLQLNVQTADGEMVPLSTFVTPRWGRAPTQLVRYNSYPAVRISGAAAAGESTGAAMAEMERLAVALPPGFAVEWTGQSYQERLSTAQTPLLLGLSMLVVFLVLAALYESWALPFSVLLVVPLGVFGAVAAVTLRGLPNGVFLQVGLITIIGLSAKNAILIVEFAKQLADEGADNAEAAIHAARLRFRPILMTSLAFMLGVLPLVIASGAASATQHAIGTGVFGGVLTATVLGVLFVPVFYVVVMRVFRRRRR